MNGGGLITSKELIERTGISRATLNNYIKMGILPKPIVRRPGPEEKGATQIGYFPLDVLERILQVKLLKQQGNSMEEIASIFQDTVSDEQEDSDDIVPEKREFSEPVLERPTLETPPPVIQRTVSSDDLNVTIADIDSPAYLINHDFEIEWINEPAEELIFNRDIKTIVDVESRNVFRLLLHEKLRNKLHNWQESVLLHLTVLQDKIDGNNLHSIYQGANKSEVELMTELFTQKGQLAVENIYHLPVTILKSDNSKASYWVHTMSFREGTFFVYVPSDSINTVLLDMLSQRDKIISELMRNRMPSLVSLCVLIADLQDSTKICAELLPAQYFELINELWQAVGPTFKKYKGIYGKHAGDGMLYYFIHKPGVNYLMNAVNCSLELREIMKEMSSKWRLRKGWNNELFLNTGINEGQEFFGTIQSSNNIEFTALGDTINIAGRLSDFARNGEIWTTKNLISRLNQDERNQVRFGVHQENQTGRFFVRNSFSRISDLITKDNQYYRHLSAIAGLPITEIRERVSQPAPTNIGRG